jgi:hypothetical protein
MPERFTPPTSPTSIGPCTASSRTPVPPRTGEQLAARPARNLGALHPLTGSSSCLGQNLVPVPLVEAPALLAVARPADRRAARRLRPVPRELVDWLELAAPNSTGRQSRSPLPRAPPLELLPEVADRRPLAPDMLRLARRIPTTPPPHRRRGRDQTARPDGSSHHTANTQPRRPSPSPDPTLALLLLHRPVTVLPSPVVSATHRRDSEIRGKSARALRWRDVDFASSNIHVRRNLPAHGEEKMPKGKRVRSVPFLYQAGAELERLSRRSYLTRPDDRVFVSQAGAR